MMKSNFMTEKTEKKIISGKNGGYRPGSGRKPDLAKRELEEAKRCIKNHGMQSPDGELTRIEMVYDKLFQLGMSKDNILALKEYLDRQMGKSTSKTEITGKDGKDLKLVTGFTFKGNKD